MLSKCPFRAFVLLAIMAAAAAAGCGLGHSRELRATEESGLVTGMVTRGPISPVIYPGASASLVPVPGISVVASAMSGGAAATTKTDEQGIYRFKLSPGGYRITLTDIPGGAISKDIPATLEVERGSETRFDIRIDTRMR